MTRTTLSDLRNVLRWSIARSVALVAAADGSVQIAPLVDPPPAVPIEAEIILQAWAPTLARLLTATGSPPVIAQLAVYWVLERQLRSEEDRETLEEWAEHRAAVRQFEAGQDVESAELCTIGDVAVKECLWPMSEA